MNLTGEYFTFWLNIPFFVVLECLGKWRCDIRLRPQGSEIYPPFLSNFPLKLTDILFPRCTKYPGYFRICKYSIVYISYHTVHMFVFLQFVCKHCIAFYAALNQFKFLYHHDQNSDHIFLFFLFKKWTQTLFFYFPTYFFYSWNFDPGSPTMRTWPDGMRLAGNMQFRCDSS